MDKREKENKETTEIWNVYLFFSSLILHCYFLSFPVSPFFFLFFSSIQVIFTAIFSRKMQSTFPLFEINHRYTATSFWIVERMNWKCILWNCPFLLNEGSVRMMNIFTNGSIIRNWIITWNKKLNGQQLRSETDLFCIWDRKEFYLENLVASEVLMESRSHCMYVCNSTRLILKWSK